MREKDQQKFPNILRLGIPEVLVAVVRAAGAVCSKLCCATLLAPLHRDARSQHGSEHLNISVACVILSLQLVHEESVATIYRRRN